jgi:Flp pilus assembly protein TadG
MRSIRVASNEAGQSMVVIALAMVALIAFVGLALDGAKAYQQRTQMQAAADSAAMAGAREVILGSNQSDIWYDIKDYAITRNLASSFTATYYPGGQSLPNAAATPPAGALGTCVTTTATYPADFIPVIGIDTMTVQASACAAGLAQSGVCGGGYVVWANSSTCTNSLLWPGKSYNTRGTVHSNSGVNVTGSSNDYRGAVEYVTSFSGGGGLQGGWSKRAVAATNKYPVNYQMADYQPGGRAATAAGSKYYSYSGTTTVPMRGSGLYYINGNATINWSSYSGSYTIVSTGKINWTAKSGSDLKPFSDGLWMFTTHPTGCDASSIALSGESNNWTGDIFAPNGGIDYQEKSDSNTNHTSFIGDHVTLGGASNNFDNLGAECGGGGSASVASIRLVR